jgi:PAS domain-containing protein
MEQKMHEDSNREEMLAAALEALPSPVFVVDDDVRIMAHNTAAVPLLGISPSSVYRTRAGNALGCVNAELAPGGCGHAEACKGCVVRNSVLEACRDGHVVRRPQRMRISTAEGEKDAYLLVTASRMEGSNPPLAVLQLDDIGVLVTLEGLVPMCMHCHKVREGDTGWSTMEGYLKTHLDLDVSHGICPDCMGKYYGE